MHLTSIQAANIDFPNLYVDISCLKLFYPAIGYTFLVLGVTSLTISELVNRLEK